MSPKIVPPLSQGVPSPRQTHGSLCPPRESTSQTAARSVQPCWHSSRLRPTDTQTRRPRNVVNNTSHLITPAMRPNNTVTPRRDDKPPPPPPPIAAADLRPCADGSAVGTALAACAAPVAQLARLGQLRQTDRQTDGSRHSRTPGGGANDNTAGETAAAEIDRCRPLRPRGASHTRHSDRDTERISQVS